MLLSKASLLAVLAAAKAVSMGVLHALHITKDGSTIATSERGILAVSPTQDVRFLRLVPDKGDTPHTTISVETIKEVIKALPKDTKYAGALEHTVYTGGTFHMADGERKWSISAKPMKRKYIDYRDMLSKIYKGKSQARCVLDMADFIELLTTLHKIADKTSTLYIEFTKERSIILRSVNNRTSQRVIGVMKSIDIREMPWLEVDEWEKNLTSKGTTSNPTK